MRLKIKEIVINDKSLLIKKMIIVDDDNNEVKEVEFNNELIKFLKCLEININDYFSIMEMKKKNPEFTKLINNFELKI